MNYVLVVKKFRLLINHFLLFIAKEMLYIIRYQSFYILHVPKLSYNLLLDNKLLKTNNYAIILYPTYCVFYNQISGKMIGNAKQKNGIYYLDTKKKETPQPYQIKGVKKKKSNLRTLLVILHVRLGHHDFHYMRKLYPILGNSLDFSKLKYEICELAKNQRVSYPISGKRSEISFSIIHINAWVSSRVTSISSAR